MNQIFSLKGAINILKELSFCERDIDSVNFDITGCSKEDAKLTQMNLKKIHELLSELDLDNLEIVQEAKVINLGRLKKSIKIQEYENNVKRCTVLDMRYINWLIEFIKEQRSFNTEPNNVGFNESLSEADKENILLIDTLFSLIVEYYKDHGLNIKQKDSNFFNQTVTVNLTFNLSIELTLWQGQGSVIEVKIVPSTDEVLIEDVILHFKLN